MPRTLAARSVELDELLVTVVVDNATDTLSSIAEGIPQQPEAAAPVRRPLVRDVRRSRDGGGLRAAVRRLPRVLGPGHRTPRGRHRHGAVRRGSVRATCGWGTPLDSGSTCRSIAVLFVSHWHGDHTGGIPAVVGAIAEARAEAGRPPLLVDVHPDRPDRRGILMPVGKFAMLPAEPTLDAIEEAGGRIVRHAERPRRGRRALPVQRRHPSGHQLRDRASRGHVTWRDGQSRTRPGDPRRTVPGGSGARSGHHRPVRLLPRRDRQRRPRGPPAGPGGSPSTCCWVATTWPERPSRTGSAPPSETWPSSCHRASSRPVTAPAGGPRARWRQPSARRATPRASSGPASSSRPR